MVLISALPGNFCFTFVLLKFVAVVLELNVEFIVDLGNVILSLYVACASRFH